MKAAEEINIDPKKLSRTESAAKTNIFFAFWSSKETTT